MSDSSFEGEVRDSSSKTMEEPVQAASDEEEASSYLAWLFWSSDPTRLRAGWRVMIAATVLLGVLLAADRGIDALGFGGIGGAIAGQVPFYVATAALLYVASQLDHRPIRAYGFHVGREWWRNFVVGTMFGVLMHAGVAAGHYGIGWTQISGTFESGSLEGPFLLAVLPVFIQFAGVALWEEALFRGVFILNAAEGLSGWDMSLRTRVFAAWSVPTVVFGGLHFFSAGGVGVSPIIVVVSAILAGIYFGLPYILTGSLSLPIGLHLGTNFADTAIFGGTSPAYDGFPAVLRLSTDFPSGWEAISGLGMPAQLVTVGLVVLWVYGTRGSLEIDSRLRQAASEK